MSATGSRLIGIDVGTTAVKAALFDADGRAADTCATRYRTRRPAPDHAEQDARDWERATDEALARFARTIDPASVAVIGLTARTNTHLFVDAAGAPLAPAIVWQDTRADDDAARLDAPINVMPREATKADERIALLEGVVASSRQR